jgi:nicotinamidase-related amidase
MFNHKTRDMTLTRADSALVLTDMQNDFLSPQGAAYKLIEKSLAEHDTATNLEKLLRAAKTYDFPVFVSPHYYYPHDHRWVTPLTPIEDLAHHIGLVDRRDPLSLDDFMDSGADFPRRYKPYLCDGKTIVASPHKAYSASTNDLVLQLRRRRIEKIVLAGPVGNLCVEAHMRDFIEHGFQVAMVRDASAGMTNDEGDGYQAAMVNWRFLAHALWTTEQAVDAMKRATSMDRERSALAHG